MLSGLSASKAALVAVSRTSSIQRTPVHERPGRETRVRPHPLRESRSAYTVCRLRFEAYSDARTGAHRRLTWFSAAKSGVADRCRVDVVHSRGLNGIDGLAGALALDGLERGDRTLD